MENPAVVTQAYQVAALTQIDDPVLAGGSIALFKNDIQPTPDLALADYTVADYTGYAVELIPSVAPSIGSDGVPELVYVIPEFRPSGSVATNIVYGCLILASGGALMGAARFKPNGGETMASVNDAINLTLRVRLSPTGSVLITIA